MLLARLRKAFQGKAGGAGGWFVPRVEGLEERWMPAAIRPLPGFALNTLAAGTNNSAQASLGFTINFEGVTTNKVFVNTNGNVSLANPLSAFPIPGTFPTTLGIPILAPFYAQVDNTTTGTIKFGLDPVGGHEAFGATWNLVDYFNHLTVGHTIKMDSFQIIIIDRADTGPGNFDVEFNYDQIKWDSSDSMGGVNGLAGTHSAVVGFTNGTSAPGTVFELPGSGTGNGFIDGNGAALVSHERLSSTPGRYHFYFRGGKLVSGNVDVTNQTNVFLPFRYIFDPATQTFRGNATVLDSVFNLQSAITTATLLDEPLPGVPGPPQTTTITLVFTNLPKGIVLANQTGVTASGFPYITTGSARFPLKGLERIPLVLKDPGRLPLSTFFGGQFQTEVFVGAFDPTTA
ncbi:MAG TPA: nidogen-like domain-containing protein [Gemmataceae bacterium]|nr:nidogen-like domain-containing protein [Gemmataceae bacterium]